MIKIISYNDFLDAHIEDTQELYGSLYPEEINSDWTLEDADEDKLMEVLETLWFDEAFESYNKCSEEFTKEVNKSVQEFKAKNN